jgi:hypothetical protein
MWVGMMGKMQQHYLEVKMTLIFVLGLRFEEGYWNFQMISSVETRTTFVELTVPRGEHYLSWMLSGGICCVPWGNLLS